MFYLNSRKQTKIKDYIIKVQLFMRNSKATGAFLLESYAKV